MANATQTQAEVEVEVQEKEAIVQNVVKAEGIQAHDTKHGSVVFINTSYVSQKFINICLKALESDIFETHDPTTGEDISNGHGVFSVVFRMDGFPMQYDGGSWDPVTWIYYHGSRSIVCNLKHCVQKAIMDGLDEDIKHGECINIRAAVWQQLLSGFIHETSHGAAFVDNPKGMMSDVKLQEEEEKRADEYARMFIFELAKRYDVEPELGAPIEALTSEAMSVVYDEIEQKKEPTDKEKAFLENQKFMETSGNPAWFTKAEDNDKGNHVIKKYKEFLHFISGDPMDDPDWAIEPEATNTVAVTGTPAECNETATGAQATYVADTEHGTPGFGGVQVQATGWGGAPMVQNAAAQPQYQAQPQGLAQPVEQHTTPVAPAAPTAPVAPVAPQMGGQQQQQINPVVNPGAGAYQAPGMDIGVFQATVKNLYMKIFQHIFQSCGYNPAMGPGQPFFMQGAKIVEQLPLSAEEQAIIKEMECYNAQGQKMQGVQVQGWISGVFIDKAQMLPGFSLTMTDPGGNQIMRKFLPQNPWKVKYGTQEYSSTALEAQQGNQIMWVIDPNAADKKMATRVYNGVLQSNAGGSWQAVC